MSLQLNILETFNSISFGGARIVGPSSGPLGLCNEKGECIDLIKALTKPFVEIYYFEIVATIFGACIIISEWRSIDKKPIVSNNKEQNKTNAHHVEDENPNYYHDG